jgi:hypothetical protein
VAGPAAHGVMVCPKWVGGGRPEEPQEGSTWLRGQVAVCAGETAESRSSSELAERELWLAFQWKRRRRKRMGGTRSRDVVSVNGRNPGEVTEAHEGIDFRIGL